MRFVVYKDKKIPQKEYDKLNKDYAAFIKKTTGIEVTYITMEWDFSRYPTMLDGSIPRPTSQFLSAMCEQVEKKYGKYGSDHIELLIHEDNWQSDSDTMKGIWGTSWSYIYGNGNLVYNRWDRDNIANSFGTRNHEIDHSFDSLIKTEIGIDINPVLGVRDYDAQTTHGGRTVKPAYHEYIRYKENEAKLKVLAPYLQAVYKKRLERHTEAIRGMQITIIGLLEKLVYLYKQKLNQKTTEVV